MIEILLSFYTLLYTYNFSDDVADSECILPCRDNIVIVAISDLAVTSKIHNFFQTFLNTVQ